MQPTHTITLAPLATALIFMVTTATCHDAEGLVKLRLLDVVLNNVESISNFSEAGLVPPPPTEAVTVTKAPAAENAPKEIPFICPTVAPQAPPAPGSSNEVLIVALLVLLGLLTQSNTKAHHLEKSSGGAAAAQAEQREQLQEQLEKATGRVSELTEAAGRLRGERSELTQQLKAKRTEVSVANHKLAETRRALNTSREVAVQLQGRILEESSKGQERQLLTTELRERVEQLELMLETSEAMSADRADLTAEAAGGCVAAALASELAVVERECEQQSHQIEVLTGLLKTQVEMNQMYTADMACVEQQTREQAEPSYHLWGAESFKFDVGDSDIDAHDPWATPLPAFATA